MNKQHSPRRLKAERLPVNWLLMAAVVLLVAVIGSSLGTANLMAQYTTSTTGTDSARVARYVVNAAKASGQSEALTLDYDNKSADYKFTVTNQNGQGINEVATAYDVVVTFPKRLEGVTLSLKNGSSAAMTPEASDAMIYTFRNAGTFTAGAAATHNLTLTFTMPDDSTVDEAWQGIQIAVNAAQID